MTEIKTRLPTPLLLLLLILCTVRSAAGQHRPRRLDKCPGEFETLVESIPPSVGSTIIEMAPDVHIGIVENVEFLYQSGLRIEQGKLVLNLSMETPQGHAAQNYIGPYVMTCSDNSDSTFSSFTLYLQLPEVVESTPAYDTTLSTSITTKKLPETPPTTDPPSSTQKPANPPVRTTTRATSTAPTTTGSQEVHMGSNTTAEGDPRLAPLVAVTALFGALCLALSIALAIVVRRLRLTGCPSANGGRGSRSRDSTATGEGGGADERNSWLLGPKGTSPGPVDV